MSDDNNQLSSTKGPVANTAAVAADPAKTTNTVAQPMSQTTDTKTQNKPPGSQQTISQQSADTLSAQAGIQADTSFGPPEVTTVVTSPHAPQKYGGKKILATIFGVLLIVGGVAAGVLLTQRQQNISERAQTATQYDAQCLEVVVYDTNWNPLSLNDLGSLTAGTTVRFAVSGISSSGTFDKARFTVNENPTQEVTDKKPGTDEFYYEYTLPENVTVFTVKGEVHHTIWGWI